MVYPSVPIKVCKTIVNKLRICRIRCLHLLRPWLTLGKWDGTRQLQSTPKRSTNQCKPNEIKQEFYTTWITWSSKLRNLRIWQGLDCESGGMSWNVLESLPFVWTTPLRSGPGVQTTAFWFEPVHPVLHCFIMFHIEPTTSHYQLPKQQVPRNSQPSWTWTLRWCNQTSSRFKFSSEKIIMPC